MKQESISIGSVGSRQLGYVWVAMSERGLIMVEFGVRREAFEASVRTQLRCRVELERQASAPTSEALCQIGEYLEGKRRSFAMKVDWSILTSDFQRTALRAVSAIPYGETRTYGQIAAQMGHPNAPRAVGRANATNPMPLVVPCHRLIGADGKLHGYGGAGGLKTKQWLLDLEKSG